MSSSSAAVPPAAPARASWRAAGRAWRVVDRAEFPRVKLCGGWLSAPIWDALALAPREYPGGLWEWSTCHVSYRGEERAVACRGWFIRRFELDDFLLRRSGAELHLGVAVQEIARDADGLWSVAGLRARHLVGAGGTHCPVARLLAPPRAAAARSACRSTSSSADPAAIARTRVGRDGEPELLLHDDLRGYSWNVPKTDWLNVGSGTVDPRRGARRLAAGARALPRRAATSRAEAAELELEAMKGHAYYLFDPAHLDGASRAADADGQRRRPPGRRQPGAGAAADRRGDPAGGGLGPRCGRGDPRRRAGELPGAPAPRTRCSPTTGASTACARRRSPPAPRRRPPAGRARGPSAHGRARLAPRPAGGRHAASPGCSRARACRRRGSSTWRWPSPSAGWPPHASEERRMIDVAAQARSPPSTIAAPPSVMRELLAGAGITVGGDAPWDIQIHDERVYARVLRDGTLGVGESYVDGWWDSPALDQMIERDRARARRRRAARELGAARARRCARASSTCRRRAPFEVGERHYDVGNDLYEAMLGPRMVYTCAYWKDADTLDAAQEAKLDLVCRKIGLAPGHARARSRLRLGRLRGVRRRALRRQRRRLHRLARAGRPGRRSTTPHLPIDIRLDDYRNATGSYDAVVSIGLMEHVGPKNHRAYMELAARCLAPGGVAFIHTIGGNRRAHADRSLVRQVHLPQRRHPDARRSSPRRWRRSWSPRTSRTSARTTTAR